MPPFCINQYLGTRDFFAKFMINLYITEDNIKDYYLNIIKKGVRYF